MDGVPSSKSEAWLLKMGWSRGDGLGKDRSGRTEIIQVVKKDDNRGLGKQSYELRDFAHWDDLFNKAAKKLDVHEHDEGVRIQKKEHPKKDEPTKPAHAPYAGMFVKASTGTMDAQDRNYNEKDLFKLCGNRELRLYGQSGKHDRLHRFDKGELNFQDPDEILKKHAKTPSKHKKPAEESSSSSDSSSSSSFSSSSSSSSSCSEIRKKKKKEKAKSKKNKSNKKSSKSEGPSKKRKRSTESSESNSAASSSESDEPPKKKKKKAKRVSDSSSSSDS